jgi:competence protein ComEA
MDAAPKGLFPPAEAWPKSAQLATAFLLGLATALLGIHAYGYTRLRCRPSELQRDAAPYQVDLNRAAEAELVQLPGVGERTARQIVAYREEHGGFHEVEDLQAVHGIGPAKLSNLRPHVRVGEADGVTSAASLPAERRRGKKEESLTEPIDVNWASLTELQRLPGIGPKMSQRIADERRKAPFRSVDDLRRVSGIGPKTLEKLRPYVTVGGGDPRVATVDD